MIKILSFFLPLEFSQPYRNLSKGYSSLIYIGRPLKVFINNVSSSFFLLLGAHDVLFRHVMCDQTHVSEEQLNSFYI